MNSKGATFVIVKSHKVCLSERKIKSNEESKEGGQPKNVIKGGVADIVKSFGK